MRTAGKSASHTVSALLPYFGGKRTTAPAIVAHLDGVDADGRVRPHHSFWDVFCGSLAPLLAKPKSRVEVVSDLHSDVTNLATVLADRRDGPAVIRYLRRVRFAERTFSDAVYCVRQPVSDAFAAGLATDPNRAAQFFVFSWMGANGFAGTVDATKSPRFCVRFTSTGGDGARRWQSAVASLPQFRDRMAGVTVLTRDAFELIPKIEDVEGVTVYCDPPYFSKTVQYVHDFTDPAAGSVDKAGKPLRNPHVVLAEMLGRFQRTRVVVSYYDHPRLAELYPVERWRRVQLVAPKFSANATNKPLQGGKRAAKVAAPELLLINQKA